ncbi:ChaN family lipoprotein [candidate division KSB1 bacterium]|nr:ChaN family lipoprotein [candidate division KSB1 bacterium]
MQLLMLLVLLVVGLSGCTEKRTASLLTPQLKSTLSEYLQQHGQRPVEYVLTKFKDHDVVFIGEFHKLGQDLHFVQNLIPKLYADSVRILATEFARREDQPLIDSLLNSPTYDEMLARKIVFLQFVPWGFQEYVDIYKAAWTLNHDLPATAPRFRILGVNDSPDWSLIKTEADRDNDEIKRQVWRGGGEKFWADVILNQVNAGRKVCVYSGMHHAFSEFQQPIVDGATGKFIRFETDRMGNFVYRAVGKRAITIFLHSPWYKAGGYDKGLVRPVEGVVDALMAELGPTAYPVAFDTKGTPFGSLPAPGAVYAAGYDAFKLQDYCDGYVFQLPFENMLTVSAIPDWYNESNLDHARLQVPNPEFRTMSLEQLRKSLQEDALLAARLSARLKK